MDKQYSDEVLEFINELQDAKKAKDDARADGLKKKQKQKLNYLFSQKVPADVKKIKSRDGLGEYFTESDIARAAMGIGIRELLKAADEETTTRLKGLLHISKLRESF